MSTELDLIHKAGLTEREVTLLQVTAGSIADVLAVSEKHIRGDIAAVDTKAAQAAETAEAAAKRVDAVAAAADVDLQLMRKDLDVLARASSAPAEVAARLEGHIKALEMQRKSSAVAAARRLERAALAARSSIKLKR
jgi:hypothetical protein